MQSAGMPDGVSVHPLEEGITFGARVEGLTRNHLKDAAVRENLRRLWIREGVIVFRGEGGVDMQLELSRCFGLLQEHVLSASNAQDCPELVNVKYGPQDGTIYDVDGERLGGWLPWHSDLVYTDTVNRGGILRPIELPETGGHTGFIDQISAYDALPPSLQKKIADLHVVYALDFNAEHQRFGRPDSVRFVRGAASFLIAMRREYRFPRVVHPMVYRQPETGRNVLNVSPWFALGIYEMGGPEGDALLHEIVDHCTEASGAYYHRWRLGDLVLWDNWRTLHCCTGIAPDSKRRLQRTTIAGDYKLGRRLEQLAAERDAPSI